MSNVSENKNVLSLKKQSVLVVSKQQSGRKNKDREKKKKEEEHQQQEEQEEEKKEMNLSEPDLRDRISSHMESIQSKGLVSQPHSVTKTYLCFKCGKEFDKKFKLDYHMGRCPACAPVPNVNPNPNPNPKQECDPEAYVMQTMLTCLGNKRSLVDDIYRIVDSVRLRLGKEKLVVMDAFSGSAVVSRKLSYLASKVISNDMEEYAYLSARCFLDIPSAAHQTEIENHIEKMNEISRTGVGLVPGFISELYAPKDTENIQAGERCFYTQENAQIIDTLRGYISREVPEALQVYCLVPLLTKASIHVNTSGVFKGFHSEDGVGKWGGRAARCLPRIKGRIELNVPLWRDAGFESEVHCRDVNELMVEIADGSVDVMYLDPPYNQHPYGSNYFMLNLIARNEAPDSSELSRVSGITKKWKRSNYNYRDKAIESMSGLLEVGLRKSRYILISYNDEGLIRDEDWAAMFVSLKIDVETHEIKYNAYRGSRNLAGRSDKVMERMYLVSSEESRTRV